MIRDHDSFSEEASREAVDIRSIKAKNLPSACDVSSVDILLRCDWRKLLARREDELVWRVERRVIDELCPAPLVWLPNEKDRLPVGDEGSEKTSRSPLALSFIIVSFSGVISELVANVSAIVNFDDVQCCWESKED
jgi:hypothetical protein